MAPQQGMRLDHLPVALAVPGHSQLQGYGQMVQHALLQQQVDRVLREHRANAADAATAAAAAATAAAIIQQKREAALHKKWQQQAQQLQSQHRQEQEQRQRQWQWQ
eukprot:scaffold111969_cov45-Phaeocystis_antarctica.AAC.1